jgi:hypothetical protein
LTDAHLQNFVRKLKKHLLPRILAALAKERSSLDPHEANPYDNQTPVASGPNDSQFVFFNSDRMYKHQLLRINYTTYNVRRSQDIINPDNSRRDVMVLADEEDEDTRSNHPFSYARILGIYHVNVVYTGPGMIDYAARRLDFLWVRWFHHLGPIKWEDCELDSVAFLPMADEEAFGFLDPHDVLRASHIIPTFSLGRVHPDTISMSTCARDSHDWKEYGMNRYARGSLCAWRLICCIIRFVDRDMIIRYYWGLGVGHIYSHPRGSDSGDETQIRNDATECRTSADICGTEESEIVVDLSAYGDRDADAVNMEYSLENRDHIDLDTSDGSEAEEDVRSCGSWSDELYLSDTEL